MPFEQLIDIHCHLLPDVDDGPGTLDQAVAMAGAAAKSGTDIIIATPHFPNSTTRTRQACKRLADGLKRHGNCLSLLPGGEIRLEHDTVAQLSRGMLPSLADTDQYYLFELPDLFIPEAVLKTFHRLNDIGITPILAHPERNKTLTRKPALLAELEFMGVELQITASSLEGRFGSMPAKMARELLTADRVTYIASDGHDTRDRKPVLGQVLKRVEKLTSAEKAFKIMFENPHKLLAHAPVLLGTAPETKEIEQEIFQ